VCEVRGRQDQASEAGQITGPIDRRPAKVKLMRVEFRRGEGWEYSVQIHRPDGVVVSLPGAGGRWPVPHDLAHFATERALRMPGGVFGSAASGAMFER
jgi:hypothetical protein